MISPIERLIKGNGREIEGYCKMLSILFGFYILILEKCFHRRCRIFFY